MNLHPDEYVIDVSLARHLLTDQMPQWSNLPLAPLTTSGTVNVLYRLGEELLVRMPRTPEYADGPLREFTIVPSLAPALPLQVPNYVALGRPSHEYPSHWSVLDWIEGTTADRSNLDLHAAAVDLADFIAALHQLPTVGAPPGGSYRASGLANVDRELRGWMRQLPDEIDGRSLEGIWETCLAAGAWQGAPTWLHGDLRGDNLIARDGKLVAIVDWEGCTVGDPSADYLAAWWLFDEVSREVFRRASGVPTPVWLRAKGWALHMAVAAIPYYSESNPLFVAQAREAIDEILADKDR